MKTILIPAEDHDAMPAVLESARLIARLFDSYIEGFAVRPSLGTYVTVEPVSSLAISGAFEGDTSNQVRTQFEAFMRANNVPLAEPGREPAVFSYAWPAAESADDAAIGSRGRVFDLIVLGRPGPDAQNPRMPPLEAALFESGKPVLIAPQKIPAVLGRNVMVAWNRSTEQAHTNALAMPLLKRAEQVVVLTVEGGSTQGPSGEEAAQNLRRNGVKAVAVTLKPAERPSGEETGAIILEEAARRGCDLLIKGAYTQSRLRQMVFGGATRHIMANAELPVLMAH